MSSRRVRGPVRQSVRGRPALDRGKSWEEPDRDVSRVRPSTFKHCCRSVATFMCTQVGVGGIIVCYALVGASVFTALEANDPENAKIIQIVDAAKGDIARTLLEDYRNNQFEKSKWEDAANSTLFRFQALIVEVEKKGYDGRTGEDKWNYAAALMFTLSIFTMIGFGNLVPRTDWGKVVTMLYAVVGIPLYILYFMNMGKALANTFKWMYRKFNSCSTGDGSAEDLSSNRVRYEQDKLLVPSSASIYVLVCYIAAGTIMFSTWEQWDWLDAVYFCVTSLCKIGLGDFVPGTNMQDTKEGLQTKLVINFVYLLVGLGLVAMCYNLLKEEVLAKLKQVKKDLRDLCSVLRNECRCCECCAKK